MSNLDELESLVRELDDLALKLRTIDEAWERVRREIIPADVLAELETAEENMLAARQAVLDRIAAVKADIRYIGGELVQREGPKTIKNGAVTVVMAFRTGWDGKLLARIAAEYPEVMRAQIVKPYIAVKIEKGEENGKD